MLVLGCPHVQAASFTPLGDFSAGQYGSTARDISADGSVVVGGDGCGLNCPDVGRSFRWTATDGMVPIEDPVGQMVLALGVSARVC
jgi:uncharacterized membrane protein